MKSPTSTYVLIIGANSFLGNKVFDLLPKKYEGFGTCFSKKEPKYRQLDITSKEQVNKIFKEITPDIVILISAFTDVDLAEEMKDIAQNVNVNGTQNVVDACQNSNAKLVYISSDYIFDGKNSPYTEESTPNPINYYGKTKLEAENIVKSLNDFIIIRPAIMYGYNNENDKPDFVKTTIEKLKDSGGLNEKVFVDYFRIKYPTLIDDIANAIYLLIDKDAKGIFNVSGDEGVTRYEWAIKVADFFNLPINNLVGINKKENVNKPRDVKLDTSKIKKLGMKFTNIDKGLVNIQNFALKCLQRDYRVIAHIINKNIKVTHRDLIIDLADYFERVGYFENKDRQDFFERCYLKPKQ